jgi:hypothetical protein
MACNDSIQSPPFTRAKPSSLFHTYIFCFDHKDSSSIKRLLPCRKPAATHRTTGASKAVPLAYQHQVFGLSLPGFPLVLAPNSHFSTAMRPDHAETADCQETSLMRMSIAFLLSKEPDIQQTENRAEVDGDRINMDACIHQQSTSSLAPDSIYPGNRIGRVQHWVASQSSTHATDSDSGYAADSERGKLYGRGQWLQPQVNERACIVSPPKEMGATGRGCPHTDRTLLADTDLMRPGKFTSPTSKRFRSPRWSYTRDEKLFIMHARVIGNVSWQDISSIFEKIFGRKDSKNAIAGLKSIYYSTRSDWGMDYVTRSGPSQRQNDQKVVNMKLSEHAVSSHSN